MKLKLLLAPLLIVSIIVIAVWLVYPAYTNGTDGYKEKKDQLAQEKSKLDNIKTKENNVSTLYSKLDGDKDSQKVVFTYIPQSIKEEEIIDNLNYLASSGGLSVANLSVSSKASVAKAPIFEDAEGRLVEDDSNAAEPLVKAVDNKVDVKLTVIGPYAQIKDLIGKIYEMERFNKVEEIDMQKPEMGIGSGPSQENQGTQSSGDSLQADFLLTFNYFKGPVKPISINNPNFSKDSFDMKTISDIKSRKNVDILQLNIDQMGRLNPFLP